MKQLSTTHSLLTMMAHKAAEKITSIPRNTLNVVEKSGAYDLLTIADKLSQEVISELLTSHFPGVPIVGEEDKESKIPGDTYFTIDPIDGTSQFVHGSDFWGITIGFIEGGVPSFGIIYQPLQKQELFAERGKGAFLDGERMYFKDVPPLSRSIVGIELGPWLKRDGIEEFVFPLLDHCLGFRSALCSTGSIIDLFLQRTRAYVNPRGPKVWDHAAGAVAVEEAGGCVIAPDGGPLKWNEILCGAHFAQSRALMDEILACFAKNQ